MIDTPTTADSATFDQWLDYYEERFARVSDSALMGYWYIYGRDSDEICPPRDMAAWAAVNAAIDARDLQP